MAKPMVDGLERELGDRVQVLRLDVLSPVGRAAANAYAVRAVPTFVLFDADGEMVYYQVGSPDKAVIKQEIDNWRGSEIMSIGLEDLYPILFILAWFAMMRYILPRFGVRT